MTEAELDFGLMPTLFFLTDEITKSWKLDVVSIKGTITYLSVSIRTKRMDSLEYDDIMTFREILESLFPFFLIYSFNILFWFPNQVTKICVFCIIRI